MFIRTSIMFFLLTICFTHGYENIALNKPTRQSHAYYSTPYPAATYGSSNAVDGRKTNLSTNGGQCAISKDGYNTATWWVNLTSIQSIHGIRIYYRTDNAPWGASNGFTARFLGFSVFISNTTSRNGGHLCFHDTNFSRATIPAVFDIKCPVHGQYVIYYNERPQKLHRYSNELSRYAHHELCEVEVNGCRKLGVYGSNCLNECPDKNCRYCHIETGSCNGCQPGYQGYRCTLPCSPFSYGEACKEKCGNCSEGRACHHINGNCTDGCGVGVYGDKCKTACPPSWHGKDCSDKCNNCERCDRFTGRCTSQCHVGWKGHFCTDACDGKMFGQDCAEECGACFGYKQCNHINGSCIQGCDAGYKGEVCKTECSGGTYGNNCEDKCSINCGIPNTCNLKNGSCIGGCKPGWEPPQCKTTCSKEMYGKDCRMRCGFCFHNTQCHPFNGSCREGCDTGYKGELCKTECDPGYFGYDCKEECSQFCKISRQCNHQTGFCKEGCKTGWKGVDCFQVQAIKEKDWESRFYGVLIILCFLLSVVILIVLSLKSIKRHTTKLKSDKAAQSIHSDKDTVTTENIPGYYQELGDMGQSATYMYEAIKQQTS